MSATSPSPSRSSPNKENKSAHAAGRDSAYSKKENKQMCLFSFFYLRFCYCFVTRDWYIVSR